MKDIGSSEENQISERGQIRPEGYGEYGELRSSSPDLTTQGHLEEGLQSKIDLVKERLMYIPSRIDL